MCTIFSQHFHNKFYIKLLLVVMGGQKINLSCGFKLELITIYRI